MSTESRIESRNGQALKWNNNTSNQRKDYRTRVTSAKAVREVFVGRLITGIISDCCEMKCKRN
jgi:hypothetical protein